MLNNHVSRPTRKKNPIFLRQVEGRGFVRKKDNAIDWGLSKPLSRASEVEWDLRNKG